MTDRDTVIKHRKRQLEERKSELKLMKRDYIHVQSEWSKRSIRYNMDRTKRRIEQLEYKLWKLSK